MKKTSLPKIERLEALLQTSGLVITRSRIMNSYFVMVGWPPLVNISYNYVRTHIYEIFPQAKPWSDARIWEQFKTPRYRADSAWNVLLNHCVVKIPDGDIEFNRAWCIYEKD